MPPRWSTSSGATTSRGRASTGTRSTPRSTTIPTRSGSGCATSAPVYRNDRYDFWALTRFDDVEAAHRDPARSARPTAPCSSIMGRRHEQRRADDLHGPAGAHGPAARWCRGPSRPGAWPSSRTDPGDLRASLLDPHVGSSEFDYVQDFAARSAVDGDPRAAGRARRRTAGAAHATSTTRFHIEPGVGMINDVSLTGPASSSTSTSPA